MSRPLAKKIESIEETIGELGFFIDRLKNHVTPDNADEKEHLADLQQGYSEARRYLLIMLNYQKGRLRREPAADTAPDTTPFQDEEDHDTD